MKNCLLIFVAFLGIFVFVSCERHTTEPRIIHNAVKDFDGNQYDAVKIGRQIWMKTNLRTTHYSDGTPIASGLGVDVVSPAYCEVPDMNIATHGLLYNWYAVVRNPDNIEGQVQGICPKGWHVPSADEWRTCIYYACNQGNTSGYFDNTAASAMSSQIGWMYCPPLNMDSIRHAYDSLALIYNNDIPWCNSMDSVYYVELAAAYSCCPGTNSANNDASGFSAVPAGVAAWTSIGVGRDANFWMPAESQSFSGLAPYTRIYHQYPCVSIVDDNGGFGMDKTYGLSVRCVKD